MNCIGIMKVLTVENRLKFPARNEGLTNIEIAITLFAKGPVRRKL